jgi:hypothetical protein
MSTLRFTAILAALLVVQTGCGKIPLISENRQNFPPWEKLPEGNGITYLEKFTFDPGTDPIYLAKMHYDDDASLQRVITTFGLVPRDNTNQVSSFAETLGEKKPRWFPLEGITHIYVFPAGDHEYVANLWVDAKHRIMILERSWW